MRKIMSVLLICLLVISLAGCNVNKGEGAVASASRSESGASETGGSKAREKDRGGDEDEDDVIVAGTVDTSSNFSFTVEAALIGFNDWEEPIVVLAGTFTNNSEESISFSWALDTTATQGGYSLESAYISGGSQYTYNDIDPGNTIPVFIAWEILDGENDINLTVIDRQHYAKEEIYSRTFTIDELIENTLAYQDSDEIFEDELDEKDLKSLD